MAQPAAPRHRYPNEILTDKYGHIPGAPKGSQYMGLTDVRYLTPGTYLTLFANPNGAGLYWAEPEDTANIIWIHVCIKGD